MMIHAWIRSESKFEEKFEYNDIGWILINYSKIYSDLALIKKFFDLI